MPSFEQDFDRLKALYDEGFPLSKAAVQIGISAMTASNWMRKAGIEVKYRRTNSEGGVGPLQHICDQCGKTYIATHAKSRFCSRSCTNDWQRVQGRNIICPCGKKVGVEEGNRTYSSAKKYCSDGCRAKYSGKRQRDESKWETYICRNPNCGKEFERRKNSRNAKHYCSLACSNKMTKTKHHVVLKDDDVLLDSSWEAFFWGACKIAKIPIERFDRERGVEWAPGKWYAPDFWLPRHLIAIEIKGYEDDYDQTRWDAFSDPGRAAFTDTGRALCVFHREELATVTPAKLAAFLDRAVIEKMQVDDEHPGKFGGSILSPGCFE